MQTRNSRGFRPAPDEKPYRRPSFEFLISVFVFCLLFGGCASPGEPTERKPPVPEAVTDLAVEQSGNNVILTFTLPIETTNHRRLEQPPAVEIYRAIRPVQSAPGAAPALLVTIPPAMLANYGSQGHVRYPDPLGPGDFLPQAETQADYTVRTRISPKKESEDSNVASLRVFPVADAIADLKSEVTHAAVVLSWTPPQKSPVGPAPAIVGYRVYRVEAEPGASSETPKPKGSLAVIGRPDAASSSFNDTTFEFGKSYVYVVRSLTQTPDGPLESSDSNTLALTPKNIFPPAAPVGLEVVFVPAQGETPAHLELSWAISPENDIAGYNIYRSEQIGVLGTRLNAGPLPSPAFRDMNVQPGRTYFYNVTAIDRSGNESPASAPVSGGVPAQN